MKESSVIPPEKPVVYKEMAVMPPRKPGQDFKPIEEEVKKWDTNGIKELPKNEE